MTTEPRHAPIVVVGAGLGGLVTALELAPAPVLLLTRSPLGREVASAWAQGGIAAALAADDSPALHAEDTLTAGDGLCDPAVVDLVTRAAPACIARLEKWGAQFDRDGHGMLALGREGGHHRRRIVHSRDATGDAVTRALVAAVQRTPSVTILEGAVADELLVEDGAIVGLVARRGNERLLLASRTVVLATGGIGGLYAHTSNPLGARGDGLALAARAGARFRDVEFMQFHPTAIDIGRDPMPLATEALRGEGAWLVNDLGERFMQGQHELADLAPRDIVARAIFRERAAGRRVFLDARTALGERFAERFPTVFAACREAGLDPARELVPVAPAAHYHMGGIATDLDAQSSVPGLWAVGEVAGTGLHGANRLASNSLLEAAVFGARAARSILDRRRAPPRVRVPARSPSGQDATAPLPALRALMDRDVGVLRNADGLARAIVQLDAWCGAGLVHGRSFENAATAALLVAAAAWQRRESRGGHSRSDYPDQGAPVHGSITLAAARKLAGDLTPPAAVNA